jgi:hypothetical protein
LAGRLRRPALTPLLGEKVGRFAFYIAVALAIASNSYLYAQNPLQQNGQNEPDSALPWLNLDSLSATRDRPLFASDRRKPPQPPIAAAATDQPAEHTESVPRPEAPKKPQLELTGIIMSASETIVLLHDLATSESVTARAGDSIGRWRISVDSKDAVTLKDGNQELRIEMYAER